MERFVDLKFHAGTLAEVARLRDLRNKFLVVMLHTGTMMGVATIWI